MENTKKIIIWVLFFYIFIIISCNTSKDSSRYYSEQGIEINMKNLKNIKFNIYEGTDGKMYFLSEKIIRKIHQKEKIISEKVGFVLQDSIQITNNDYKNIAQIIDINSYKELDENLLYLDKKNVYFNFKSDMVAYPYGILDLNPSKTSLIKGYFIKDEKSVYSYGGVSCEKLSNVNVNLFHTKKFKNLKNGNDIYLAFDTNKIFHNTDILTLIDLEEIPINKKSKDSLRSIYFLKN